MRLLCIAIAAVVGIGTVGCSGQEMSDEEYAGRMAEEHREDSPVPGAAAEGEPATEVETQTVTYATVEGNDVSGYLAKPKDGEGPLSGIIVIHEWWGLNDNIRTMAEKLAGEGYTALAVDLYGGQIAQDADGAQQLMQAAMQNVEAANQNLREAYAYLEAEQQAPRIGTIGWCFGGGWSLNTALLLPDRVDATIIYYGRLVTDPERLEALQMPILGIFGAEDSGIPVEMVEEFGQALDTLEKDASIHIYEGAEHAFANPSGTRYKADAATDAWEKTLAFFFQHLKRS